jgi:PAS domain S-box-containing protein
MTNFKDKSKEQLINELENALKKIKALEKPGAEQKDVKEALEISEQRFKNIVQSSPMGILIYKLEPGGSLIFQGANPSAERILEADTGQFIGKTIEEAFPPLKETEVPERYRRAASKGESWFTEQITYKDSRISGVYEVYAFQTAPNSMAAMFLDISSRKQAEQELKNSEEKYRQLVQYSNDAIYILYNRKFDLINEKFKEMFSVTLEDVNRPDFDFLELVAPKSRPHIEERNKKLARGEEVSPRYYFTALAKDGREIEVEASIAYMKYKDSMASQGILRDVTERKRMEEKLHQVQKLEAIGTLAGGIAHDFNNMLMGVQGRVSLMLLKTDSPSLIENLKSIEEYIDSAAELTRQLLSFARGGKYELKPLNINKLIARTSRMFGRTKKEIKIHEKYFDDIRTVEADAGQIEQVLLNLYVNAWQAMPGGGNLYLETGNINITENDSNSFQGRPGNYVKISVTDNGIGMDEAVMARIFDPFFTTKQAGRGTGLGLATVYGIIKNHGGFIDVYSEVGRGTTFSIYLPVTGKAPWEKQISREKIWKGSGAVLLVDDEKMILNVAVPLLNGLGYEAFTASSGQEAIEIYQNNKDGIDLIILDIVMPDIGGEETFNRLKEINPRVKVLLSSGYSVNEQAAGILKRGADGFIQKPFDIERLSRKMKEILKKK